MPDDAPVTETNSDDSGDNKENGADQGNVPQNQGEGIELSDGSDTQASGSEDGSDDTDETDTKENTGNEENTDSQGSLVSEIPAVTEGNDNIIDNSGNSVGSSEGGPIEVETSEENNTELTKTLTNTDPEEDTADTESDPGSADSLTKDDSLEEVQQPDDAEGTSVRLLSFGSARMASVPANTSEPTPLQQTDELTDKPSDLIEGVVYIPNYESSTDIPVKYLYSDSYFAKSSIDNFDYDLAAISAVLANASAISRRSVNPIEGEPETYTEQTKNIQTILRELGFENITYNTDYTQSGTPFTTGILCATKKVNLNGTDYTILGIFPRSFGYTLEWANNGEIGPGSDPSDPAANNDASGPKGVTEDKILTFVEDYLRTNNISGDLKIWSSGVSRGGGLSMLTSAYIDDMLENGETDHLFGIEGLKLTTDDVYTYTFGAPNWADKTKGTDDIYKNIHNYAVDYDILYKLFSGNWGLAHYGEDNILDTEDAKAQLKNMMEEYAVMLGKDITELVDTGFFIEEDGKIIYKPLDPNRTYEYTDYDAEGTPTVQLELGEFLEKYMNHLTTVVERSEYAANQEGIQTALTIALGQRDKLGALKDAIRGATIEVGTEILATALQILIEKGPEEALDYLDKQTQLDNLTSAVLINAFETAGIKYAYDFENREEITDKERAKELYAGYLDQLVNEANLLLLSDIQGSISMYNASGNLWSAHDVIIYTSWMRVFSPESGYYLNPLNEGEKWGYRMVYLPDLDDIEINVYNGNKDNKSLEGTINSDGYERVSDFDPYVHIGVDLNGNKVLYLRSDKEYVLELNPRKSNASSESLKIDEFKYEYSYQIFDPMHTILSDDHPISFTQILNMIQDGNYELSDSLILEIGRIPFNDGSKRLMRTAGLFRDVPAADDKNSHEAEYYWISKLIQLGGAVQNSIGGKVNSLDYYLTDLLFDRNNPTLTGTMNASPFSGYRFLGWYTPDGKLVSTSLNFNRQFTFDDSSVLYYARFELIPNDKKDSKTDTVIIPTDGWNEVNIPVEITSARTYRQVRVPNTADDSRASLWMMFLASITAAGISMYLLKERD